MKIQKINESLFVSLPRSICRAKGWDKGHEVRYRINEKGEIVLY